MQAREKHNVDIVFFGHLHSYSRIGPVKDDNINTDNGVTYIQTGGAGGNLEDFAPTKTWFSQKPYAGHHYCLINVNGDRLFFKMYDLQGNLRDYMEMRQNEKGSKNVSEK